MRKTVGMHDNVDTMVRTIGALVIALFVVGAIFGLWTITNTFLTKGGQKLTSISTTMDESDYTQYDGTVVSGTQVVAAIKYFDKDMICVRVKNGNTSTDYVMKQDLSGPADGKLAEATNKKFVATTYINPNSKYVGKIIRQDDNDKNSAIVCIEFTRGDQTTVTG